MYNTSPKGGRSGTFTSFFGPDGIKENKEKKLCGLSTSANGLVLTRPNQRQNAKSHFVFIFSKTILILIVFVLDDCCFWGKTDGFTGDVMFFFVSPLTVLFKQ
jgi:hypothetical protein